MADDKLRVGFEAWAKSEGLYTGRYGQITEREVRSGPPATASYTYIAPSTEQAWHAWQAAHADGMREGAEGMRRRCDVVARDYVIHLRDLSRHDAAGRLNKFRVQIRALPTCDPK